MAVGGEIACAASSTPTCRVWSTEYVLCRRRDLLCNIAAVDAEWLLAHVIVLRVAGVPLSVLALAGMEERGL